MSSSGDRNFNPNERTDPQNTRQERRMTAADHRRRAGLFTLGGGQLPVQELTSDQAHGRMLPPERASERARETLHKGLHKGIPSYGEDFPHPDQKISKDHIIVIRYFLYTSENNEKETYYVLKDKNKKIRAWIDQHKANHSDIIENHYNTLKHHLDETGECLDSIIKYGIGGDMDKNIKLYKAYFEKILDLLEHFRATQDGEYTALQIPEARGPGLDTHTIRSGASWIAQREQQRRQQEEQEQQREQELRERQRRLGRQQEEQEQQR